MPAPACDAALRKPLKQPLRPKQLKPRVGVKLISGDAGRLKVGERTAHSGDPGSQRLTICARGGVARNCAGQAAASRPNFESCAPIEAARRRMSALIGSPLASAFSIMSNAFASARSAAGALIWCA